MPAARLDRGILREPGSVQGAVMRLDPFQLERLFAEHEFTARHLLSCSDAESMPLRDLLDLEPSFRGKFEETWLGYSDSRGLPELRSEIAKEYAEVAPDGVLAHTGAQEPLFNLMNALLSPGDHVITHFPCYQSFHSVPRAIGCEVSRWEARFENRWRLDPADLKKLLRPHTKLVLVNFPHNPTGGVATRSEFGEIISILRERGVWLLSDEVYRGLEMDPGDRLPPACDLYEKAFSLGVLSKAYGLAGLRVGWLATQDRKALEQIAGYKDYTTICGPVVAETLATLALRHREKIISRNQGILNANLVVLEKFFKIHPDRFEWVAPLGGTMAFPRARTGFDLRGFAERLIRERGALLVTGSVFEMDDRYFRFGFGRRAFPEALREMEALL